MLFKSFAFRTFTLLAFACNAVDAQFQLFNSTASISAAQPLSANCATALQANINCPAELLNLGAAGGFEYSTNNTASICATSCVSSLKSFHDGIAAACKTGNDPYPWPGMPATWVGDTLWAYTNRTCLKNTTTGRYCTDEVLDWYTPLNQTTNIQNIPKSKLCSPCFYNLITGAQATPYSNYDSDIAALWQQIQTTCGTALPTTVPPRVANFSISQLDYANTSSLAPATCLSGTTYTVATGDTCNSIAIARNVATGTLITVNNLYADCSRLAVGSSICIPLSCTTRTIQTGDTCYSIASANKIGFNLLRTWNPAINVDCSNLVIGQNICISPPGGAYTPTTIAGASPTGAGPYGTATVAPPGPTAPGTTSQCSRWYKVASGDFCQKISLNQTITVDLFMAINPSINSGCTNLQVNLYYCVQPLSGWNQTTTGPCTTPTAVAAPAPTTTGAKNPCYKWYTVVSGDTCDLVGQKNSITSTQLLSWNPAIHSNCDNLVLGNAYCVAGSPPSGSCGTTTTSATTQTSTTTTAVSTPTPHQANMTTGCKKFYKAVSGDYCDKIATANSITTANFISWNPDVKSDCSAIWVDNYYCVGT